MLPSAAAGGPSHGEQRALPLPSSAILGNFLQLPEPQFTLLRNGSNRSPYLLGFNWERSEVTYVKPERIVSQCSRNASRGVEGPGGHSKAPGVTRNQPRLKVEELVLCDGPAELGKLSHWARKCLGSGYSLSHRPDIGEPSLQPPPEMMLHASVGWLQCPLSSHATSQRSPPQPGRPGCITGTRPTIDTLRRAFIPALRMRQLRLGFAQGHTAVSG